MQKTALTFAVLFSVVSSFGACSPSGPAGTSGSTGNGPGSPSASTGGPTGAAASSGTSTTGAGPGSTGGASSTGGVVGSTTATGSPSGTGTGTGTGGAVGTSGGWMLVGSIADPGQGNVFISNALPLPGPSNLPQVVFAESLGGVLGLYTTYWDGGYVVPELIYDGGQGDLYNLQGANWQQGRINLAVGIDTHFNLVTVEQVDGGPWLFVTTDASPIPAGGFAPVFDTQTGEAWIAGLAETFTNGSNLSMYLLNDAGVTVPFPDIGASSIGAAPCTKPDGGSLICVVYTTGLSEQVLWIQTFDPATQEVGNAGVLFDSGDAGFDGFTAGGVITEISPGTVVVVAAGLGPGMPQNTQQFAWASFALADLGTLQAPNLYASDAGAPQGFPALWTWNGNAFLLFRETSTLPEAEVGVALGGPEVPGLPVGAGVSSATAYPAGYADSANVNYVALPTTAQGGKLSVYSLSP